MFSEEIRKVEAQEPNAVGIYPNVRRDARETQRGTQACIEDHWGYDANNGSHWAWRADWTS